MAARAFSTGGNRPFKVLGLQQVALGNLSKSDLSNFWCNQLGLSKVHEFQSERENVDEDVLTVGKGTLGTVEVDLMAPLDPEKKPKVHVPALNHIGIWVDDLEKAVDHLEKNEIKTVGGIRMGASGHNITFVHPKSACGVLLELVQAPPEVIRDHAKHENTTEPLTIVVRVEIKEDRLEEFHKVMQFDVDGSRAEPGCLRFDLLQEQGANNRFVFYESYIDAAALDQHKETAHYKAWADFKASGGVISQEATKYGGVNFQK